VGIPLRTPGGRLDGSVWVFVLLLLLTLVPAACVLWFMNEALARASETSRQEVLEAYRGQLRLVRARLDPLWRAHAAGLNALGDPQRQFEAIVAGVDSISDGAVILGPDGSVVYPDAAAREQLHEMDRRRAADPNVELPTQYPLQLSFEFMQAERPAPQPEVIRQTAVPDTWALTSGDGRVITLYSTGRLEEMMHDFLHQITSPGIQFIALPPDGLTDDESIAAGPWLPGWQVSFFVLDKPGPPPSDRRVTEYLAVGLAGLALVIVAGVATGQMLRRHLRVARLKTDLVAAAAHELRTPVASMRVLVDGLLADAALGSAGLGSTGLGSAGLDPAKTREYLELMAGENARLSRLIENFLTFSRLDRGRYQFEMAPADPSAIVAGAVAAVRDRLPDGSTLAIDVDPSLPLVIADAAALETALLNLLDNALKYTPENKRIAVRAHRDAAFVQFVVSDNGIGIPVREQRRIFRRFYRVDQRLARDSAGVGLGLSIVELIAQGHGGTTTVRSEPGQGSTFTLRVPAAAGGSPRLGSGQAAA
jgi:signal transduction histidine kinase